ncbi:MAG TPA: GFA family protein [Stellaceae bacterium]|nr:GFA family protein [Stellaceae bacterium]
MERVAECHCGQLKAIASGEPDRVYVCHCKACQRRTGSVIHNGSRWAREQVRIEGEHKIYARQADSGFEIRFHFCPNCGSNVFWEGDRAPGWYGITVGSFADPAFPAPLYGLFEEDMHPWIDITTAKEHFEKGFPSPPPAS